MGTALRAAAGARGAIGRAVGMGRVSQLINELSLTLNARSSGLPLGSDEAPVTSGDATWGPWLPKSEAVTGDL